jgi:hypothetical protein
MLQCGYYQANIFSKISFLTKILKTMKNFIFSFFAISTLIFASCQKDVSISETISAGNVKTDGAKNVDSTINVNINVPESAGIVYVYNGQVVDAKDINFSNDDLVDASGFITNDPTHYIFDNDDKLEIWANQLTNGNAKSVLLNLIEDGRKVREIATNTNAVAFETLHKGEAPAAYKTQVNDYWEAKYGNRPIPESYGIMYNYCIAVEALFPIAPGVIWSYPNNARNKMSYLEAIGLTGEMFATRSFLFGKKWYFWPPGVAFGMCLNGHWFNNNNASSIGLF